ncbi:MAG: toprim domain-containing protein [Stellaceae bacterium]
MLTIWPGNGMIGMLGGWRAEPLILVEGLFDALSLATCGISCSATIGRWAQWLPEVTRSRVVWLAFDAIKPGEAEATRYAGLLPGADLRRLRRLLAASIHSSVQTTVVAGHGWVVDWVAEFCLHYKVRQLSILPFIPRGSGKDRRDDYELTSAERAALRENVVRKRRELTGRLDMRWLDFTVNPVPVVEANGRVNLEHTTEAMDTLICQIPTVRDQWRPRARRPSSIVDHIPL